MGGQEGEVVQKLVPLLGADLGNHENRDEAVHGGNGEKDPKPSLFDQRELLGVE